MIWEISHTQQDAKMPPGLTTSSKDDCGLRLCKIKGDFDRKHQVPAMVAAVSSASSLSFSSCRFSSSLWCFLCNSSITFWWDSSMAAKPLSHVACEGRKRGTTVSSGAARTWTHKGSRGGERGTIWALCSRLDADRRRFAANSLQATAG